MMTVVALLPLYAGTADAQGYNPDYANMYNSQQEFQYNQQVYQWQQQQWQNEQQVLPQSTAPPPMPPPPPLVPGRGRDR